MSLLAAATVAIVAILGSSAIVLVLAEFDYRKQLRDAAIRAKFNR